MTKSDFVKNRVAEPKPDPDPAFHLNVDPSQLFTSRRMRIQILIEVLGIFDQWSNFLSLWAPSASL
jgi:hypothetical protein